MIILYNCPTPTKITWIQIIVILSAHHNKLKSQRIKRLQKQIANKHTIRKKNIIYYIYKT